MTRHRAWATLISLLCLCLPLVAEAHPLGNFTTNQYVGVHVQADQVTIDYVLDLAEVPAAQARRDMDDDADGAISESESGEFQDTACAETREAIAVGLDSTSLTFDLEASALDFPDGEASLLTLRLECRFVSVSPVADGQELTVDISSFPDRTGWVELVLTGEGVTFDSDLPSESVTDRLRTYPEDLLSSPTNRRTGSAEVAIEAGTSIGLPPPQPGTETVEVTTRGPIDQLAALIDPAAGAPTIPIAMLVAVGLGIIHALAPGHGKTVMAAYLVGSKGTGGQAVLLGVAVAFSHTIGVLALGGLTLLGTSAFEPEDVFPILSVVSGLIVTGIGTWMLIRWWKHRASDGNNGGHPHDHSAGHDHDHHHGPGGHTHEVPAALAGAPGWKVLASMGLAGGLVPSTSAVVLLLAAVNLGRIPLGIGLIALFGLGMAATLVGVGFLLVTASRVGMERFSGRNWMWGVRRFLTPVAAVVVILVGAFLTLTA